MLTPNYIDADIKYLIHTYKLFQDKFWTFINSVNLTQ